MMLQEVSSNVEWEGSTQKQIGKEAVALDKSSMPSEMMYSSA